MENPDTLSLELLERSAAERIQLLADSFGSRMMATTSFGLQAAVMLHLIHENAPQTPIVFIDTGFLFPETYQYIEQLTQLLDLNLRVYQPLYSAARIQAVYGNLWEQGKEGLDQYALLTKIEPMNRALKEAQADVWLSGLRRSQSSTRKNRNLLEPQKNTLKAYPILDWSDDQVNDYLNQHQLPRHPLEAQGYVTMGDWHSTSPATHGNPEATRFGGQKYECGLHLDSGNADFQI